MPKAFPAEFRADAIALARKGEAPLRQIAKDFGISEACLHRWLKIADRDDGVDRTGSPVARDESTELREARKRIKLLEQEADRGRRAQLGLGPPSNRDHLARRTIRLCRTMSATRVAPETLRTPSSPPPSGSARDRLHRHPG